MSFLVSTIVYNKKSNVRTLKLYIALSAGIGISAFDGYKDGLNGLNP